MKNTTNKENAESKTSSRSLPDAPMAMPAQSLERRVSRRTSFVLPFAERLAAK